MKAEGRGALHPWKELERPAGPVGHPGLLPVGMPGCQRGNRPGESACQRRHLVQESRRAAGHLLAEAEIPASRITSR